ncbi:hypothetical protein BD324DRAFT_649480 [Kockovaella imperatae]|uniref:Uncharacterized protein n=1 Tax=Kockovaella imperatae TaxID=4999 RepID=A0A1Y1UQI6_9TREE|nr:hypothetical protein BD324DRAFT_649480 [Kockovaella imperatae]ORX39405.1 hypothetical protein BD324DRAFT_649480 [Kockovaella imperatae]
MPSMSPRKMAPASIVIPPRLSFCLSESSISDSEGPCTPSPHTPAPFLDFPSSINKGVGGMRVDEDDHPPAIGSKRSREDDDAVDEPVWTSEELDTVQSTLVHPFRPLSQSFPPGDLPPPHVIDELTNQILAYAFRTSPTKRASGESENTTDFRTEGWTHSWEATRKKMFDIALSESKGEIIPRRTAKETRTLTGLVARPGLKRMDSMDFLDEGEEKAPDSLGRALRLSTSLQNSAKHEVLSAGMSRSSSDNTISSETSRDRPSLHTVSVTTTITLTPSSPNPAESPAPTAHAPMLKRRGSSRAASLRRPTSLLQRGKSFTASDLAAEANSQAKTTLSVSEALKSSPNGALSAQIYDSPLNLSPVVPQESSLGLLASGMMDNVNESLASSLHPPIASVSVAYNKPKLSRSVSSSEIIKAHSARDQFLAIKPMTSDRSALARPLNLDTKPVPVEAQHHSGWSDSDDDLMPRKPRVVKKIKGGKVKALKVQAVGLQAGDRGGLRSPFEEKAHLELDL